MNPASEPWDCPSVTASNDAQAAARPAGLHRHRHSRRRPLRVPSARPVAPACRPEAELLLCCARTHLGPGLADRIKSLAQEGIDWSHLVELARTNGVTPLLYRSLAATCAEAVPRAAMGLLKQHYRANALRSLVLTAELLELLKLLDAHGVQAVPFKGPVLAARAYGDIAFREFCDLDILVHPRDARRARGLLISHGYRPHEEMPGGKECSACWQKHWLMVRADGSIAVELHWRITGRHFPRAIDHHRLWDRLGEASLMGTTVRTLCPEDTLLVLAAHGTAHCWDRLTFVCDLAQLIHSQGQLRWDTVAEQARRMGSGGMLRVGLALAGDLLGVATPEDALAEMAPDGAISSIAREASQQILSAEPNVIGHVERVGLRLRTMDRLRDKMLYCIGLMRDSLSPNMTDRSSVPLPKLLNPLYYLVRPVRIAVTYGPSALRYLIRGAP